MSGKQVGWYDGERVHQMNARPVGDVPQHLAHTAGWVAVFAGDAPALSVQYHKMPESNGRNNWTALLYSADKSECFTIDRSEYPHRVRYEADRMRHIIGELAEAPHILDYDADERTPCHLCGGSGEKDGAPCWGLNFKGTVHPAAPITLTPAMRADAEAIGACCDPLSLEVGDPA